MSLCFRRIAERLQAGGRTEAEAEVLQKCVFLLPGWLFAVPAKPAKGLSANSLISQRVKLFLRGEIATLEAGRKEAAEATLVRANRPPSTAAASADFLRKRVLQRLRNASIARSASLLASTDTTADLGAEEVISALDAKIKTAPVPTPAPIRLADPPGSAEPKLTEGGLKSALRSFSGTGTGPSGWGQLI